MDGSGASGGEGCLGRFRHLRALLVVPWPLIPNIPNSEPELDPKITRFGRSLDGFSSFPAQPRLTSSGGAFHTPVQRLVGMPNFAHDSSPYKPASVSICVKSHTGSRNQAAIIAAAGLLEELMTRLT
jgi:hypothetical protein